MKDFQITLTDKKEICENTYSFTFDVRDLDFNFEAGQYAHFTLMDCEQNDPKGNSRPFSIASSPDNKDSIMIAARTGSSAFVDNLHSLPLESKIFMSKASGDDLTLNTDRNIENVFVAGGIGITPVRSIIEYVSNNKLKNKISLFYSNKTESQIAFLIDFEKWSEENINFRFIPSIEDLKNKNWKYEFGKIEAEMLKKYLNEFENKHFYLIGPPLMVESTKEILFKEKVPEANIKTEKFK